MSLRLRHLPNIISSLRIVLVAPIAWSLLQHRLALTLAMVGVAAASDAADGFLAKRFHWQSAAGAVLDPIADKLLLATLFVVLALLRLIPAWLMVAVVARDVIIVAGAIGYRLLIGPVQARPSLVSKFNTFCEAAFVLSVIAHEQFELPPQWTVTVLGALTFLTVTISGIDYVLRYGRSAWSRSDAAAAGAGRAPAGPGEAP